MFHTKNINYKMLSKDSLDAVRKFVTTENNLFNTGISYLPHAPINRSYIWKPYTNLLKPITNYIKEKGFNITALGSNRIEGNTKKRPFFMPNKVNGTNTVILIPLFDYSREQKILHFTNTNCALNSTLVFDHSLHRCWVNESNTKFCFLVYGLNESINVVTERLS